MKVFFRFGLMQRSSNASCPEEGPLRNIIRKFTSMRLWCSAICVSEEAEAVTPELSTAGRTNIQGSILRWGEVGVRKYLAGEHLMVKYPENSMAHGMSSLVKVT